MMNLRYSPPRDAFADGFSPVVSSTARLALSRAKPNMPSAVMSAATRKVAATPERSATYPPMNEPRLMPRLIEVPVTPIMLPMPSTRPRSTDMAVTAGTEIPPLKANMVDTSTKAQKVCAQGIKYRPIGAQAKPKRARWR